MKFFCKPMFFCLVFMAAGIGYAQVDRAELGNYPPVTFYNYEGPQAVIQSREQIRQIGVPLGQAVRTGSATAGAQNRYFVIHSVSAPEGSRLDADIFGLGANVGVDHIRNLRRIIQGYLQEAYNYSESDAALLAEFITIYNAVYRGNWDYFSGRYKTAVLGHLTPQRAGLSVRYSEWPGQTLILIPLSIGGLSAVDTSVISDSRVIEEMRKDDDKGVEQRQDLVDLKEREAAEAERRAAEQREAARAEEAAIAAERARVEQEQRQIAEDRRKLEEDKAAGTVTEEEAAQREAELDQKEAEAEQKSGELDQREEAVARQQEDAAKQEEFAEQKAEEARQDREQIAQDQQTIIDRGETPQGILGAIIERQGATLGRLIIFNPSNRQELRRSSLNSVSVRTITFIGERVLAIAGETGGNNAIRLVEINSRTLEMVKQGNDNIHPGSLLWVNGSNLYAITTNPDGTCNLGRFGVDLALQAKSRITVNPNATVIIQQGNLLTQRADGGAAILNPTDLTER